MDQLNEPEFECLSTSYNTLTVTISESAFHGTTDLCLRVSDRGEYEKLKKLMNAITLNTLLVLDTDDKRETTNIRFGSGR